MKIKDLIITFLAAALMVASCAKDPVGSDRESFRLSCVQPHFLKPGDKIALISPSYHTPMENVEGAAEVVKSWGLEPVVGENVDETFLGHYAGTPKERLSDLEWALRDPSIKAILCNRGGYGSIRFVNMLPLEDLASHPKWIIGFSDITTLHGMASRAGVMSIHGTMSSFLAKSEGKDLTSTLVRDILTGTIPEYEVPAHPQNIPGHATGTLVGGNICTFTPVIGTEADATAADDIILFIEEVEEDMSHIDRLVNMLILNGVFDRCKGVVLGEFSDCEANLDFGSVEEMICSYLKDYGIPVLCGFPSGHGDINLPLVMGSQVTMDVTGEGSKLRFNMDGQMEQIPVGEVIVEQSGQADPAAARAVFKQHKLIRLFNFARTYKSIRH